MRGRASNLVFATLNGDGVQSQATARSSCGSCCAGGVIAPSFVVSSTLTDSDIRQTLDADGHACALYRRALEWGDPSPWMGGRPVRPVFRRHF